jgi:hypothetical protein
MNRFTNTNPVYNHSYTWQLVSEMVGLETAWGRDYIMKNFILSYLHHILLRNHDSSVGIATLYRLDGRGLPFRAKWLFFFSSPQSRDSSVGIATGYGLDGRGDRSSSPDRVKNFLFSTSSRPALGPTPPPIQWVPGALSREVKRQGREADHSPPTSTEVKKLWTYTSTLPYAFRA